MKITLLTGKTYNIAQAFDFELRVVKNPRAKKLTLRIDSKERVPVLSIPRYCSQKRAIQFVEEHRLWIKEALSRIPEHKLFENGETIPLFGKEVTIVHAPERRLGAKLEGNTLLVSGEAEFLHRRVKDFIKKKAQSEFLRRSKKYAKKLGVSINGVTIKMAHEVAHLSHADHSSRFWHCVSELCPTYAEGETWLKLHGKDLYLYE